MTIIAITIVLSFAAPGSYCIDMRTMSVKDHIGTCGRQVNEGPHNHSGAFEKKTMNSIIMSQAPNMETLVLYID